MHGYTTELLANAGLSRRKGARDATGGPPCSSITTHLVVVCVPDQPASVLLSVDGFSLATLHGVNEGNAPDRGGGGVRQKSV